MKYNSCQKALQDLCAVCLCSTLDRQKYWKRGGADGLWIEWFIITAEIRNLEVSWPSGRIKYLILEPHRRFQPYESIFVPFRIFSSERFALIFRTAINNDHTVHAICKVDLVTLSYLSIGCCIDAETLTGGLMRAGLTGVPQMVDFVSHNLGNWL